MSAVRADERAMKLMAYADGELEGAELAEVEAWLAQDAESILFANDLAELGDLVKTGHAAKANVMSFDIADAVMAKIEAESAEKPSNVVPLRAAPAKKRNTVGWVVAGLALAASVFFVLRSNKEADEAPLARTTSPLVQPQSVAASVSAGTVDVENPGSSVSVIYVPDESTVPNVTTVVWVNDENGGGK